MKESREVKPRVIKFSVWDTIVLLILLLIFPSFLLGIFEGVVSGNNNTLGVNTLLVILTFYGLIKYFRKFGTYYRNPENRKRALKLISVVALLTCVFYALLIINVLRV